MKTYTKTKKSTIKTSTKNASIHFLQCWIQYLSQEKGNGTLTLHNQYLELLGTRPMHT